MLMMLAPLMLIMLARRAQQGCGQNPSGAPAPAPAPPAHERPTAPTPSLLVFQDVEHDN